MNHDGQNEIFFEETKLGKARCHPNRQRAGSCRRPSSTGNFHAAMVRKRISIAPSRGRHDPGWRQTPRDGVKRKLVRERGARGYPGPKVKHDLAKSDPSRSECNIELATRGSKDSATSDVFRFKCKRCPRTAISLSRMVEHVRSTHCQKKQFNDVVHDDVTFPSDSFMYEAQCKQCHEVFLGPRTAMTLAFQHMRTNHNRRMDHLELRCRACQRVFSTTSRQNSHILDRRHSCLVLSKRNFFKDSSGAGTSSSWPPAKKANLRLWSDGTNAAREKDLGHEDQRSALSVTSQDTQRTANVQSRESINIVDGNIATSANSSVYQCFYCPVKCKAAYAKKHLKVHVDNTFKCLICQVPVRFHTIQEARVHFRENHGITVTSHLDLVGESAHLSIPADCRCCSCTSCGIVFAAQDAFKLQTHVNKFHRGVAVPFHMYCRLCLTPFASYSKLFEHCWGRGGRPFCVPPQAWDNLAAVVTVLSACP